MEKSGRPHYGSSIPLLYCSWGQVMGDQSRNEGPNGLSRLERINRWIRIAIAIVIPTVFIVAMIAYYFKYRR